MFSLPSFPSTSSVQDRILLPDAKLTFLSTGFRNHNDAWILRPSPAREQARHWLARITSPQ